MKYRLTDSTIKVAKPKPDGKPVKVSDGGGLFLLVNRVGKYWRYNYRYNGKQRALAVFLSCLCRSEQVLF
ncbi:MAG: Arm DNA-binding domain-containing protein [Thiolinea sp.]